MARTKSTAPKVIAVNAELPNTGTKSRNAFLISEFQKTCPNFYFKTMYEEVEHVYTDTCKFKDITRDNFVQSIASCDSEFIDGFYFEFKDDHTINLFLAAFPHANNNYKWNQRLRIGHHLKQ